MHPRDNLKAASELHRLGAVSADPHPSPCTALHHTPCTVVGATLQYPRRLAECIVTCFSR